MRKQKGAAAVEFAVILPLLLALVIGIIDFGHLFWHQCALTNAAREGVREAVKGGGNVNWVVTSYINSYYTQVGFPSPTVSTQVNYYDNDGNSTIPVRGAHAIVTVTEQGYQFPIIPFQSMFDSLNTLTASAVMRHE